MMIEFLGFLRDIATTNLIAPSVDVVHILYWHNVFSSVCRRSVVIPGIVFIAHIRIPLVVRRHSSQCIHHALNVANLHVAVVVVAFLSMKITISLEWCVVCDVSVFYLRSRRISLLSTSLTYVCVCVSVCWTHAIICMIRFVVGIVKQKREEERLLQRNADAAYTFEESECVLVSNWDFSLSSIRFFGVHSITWSNIVLARMTRRKRDDENEKFVVTQCAVLHWACSFSLDFFRFTFFFSIFSPIEMHSCMLKDLQAVFIRFGSITNTVKYLRQKLWWCARRTLAATVSDAIRRFLTNAIRIRNWNWWRGEALANNQTTRPKYW